MGNQQVPIRTVIHALRRLQEVDKERIEAEKERRMLLEKLETLEQGVQELERALAEKHEKLKEAERWYEEREKELKADNDKIKRLQTRLAQTTKAKEYANIQREIELLRRTNAQREEEILKLLAAIDEFRADVENDQKNLEETRKELLAQREAMEARINELNSLLGGLEEQHKGFEADIPPPVLQRYKKIQQAWQGLAVVPVDEKGSCGGCHRQVPPQMLNILLRRDSLESCPYCNRFIYVKVDEEDEK
jgi:predicted  nucleic acid-binding Zn-ribbon protein